MNLPPGWMLWIGIIVVGGVAGVVAQGVVSVRRRRNPYRELLEPLLARHGFSIVSSSTPPLLDVGPFPKLEGRLVEGRTETRLGVSGQHVQYRVVKFFDRAGVEREAWARLTFQAFRLDRVDWLPRLEEIESLRPS